MHPKLLLKYREFLSEVADSLSSPVPCVDIENLCRKLRVEVVRATGEKNKDGYLTQTGNSYKISISRENAEKKEYTPSERFIIAHEIGHLLLIRKFSLNPKDEGDYWQIENLCDYFARKLLLPNDYMAEKINKIKLDLRNILGLTNAIAKETHAPWPAIAHRIVEFEPALAFFKVTISYSNKKPIFLMNMSTLHNKKIQNTKFSIDNELGRLLTSIDKKSSLYFDKTVFQNSSINKKFPSFATALEGLAYRSGDREIQLIIRHVISKEL